MDLLLLTGLDLEHPDMLPSLPDQLHNILLTGLALGL